MVSVNRLAIVSGYPPQTGNLAEYATHLAGAYQSQTTAEVTVLGPTHPDADAETTRDGVHVKRCWTPDRLRSAANILRELRAGDYDAVHYNLQTTWFGETNRARFTGLALPALTRALNDARVLTTLHDSLDFVDPSVLPERVGPIKTLGARAAAQLALLAHQATTTTRSFARTLQANYPFGSIEHVPHGTFEPIPEFSPPRTDPFRVLAFGHIAPHKDYDTLFAAYRSLRDAVPTAQLHVAGDAHPQHPGEKRRLDARYGDWSSVTFHGYIPEDDVPALFRRSSVVVLPYRTCTGVSGVHHLALTHGRPVVTYDTEDMRTATVQAGGVAEFVTPGAPDALAERLAALANHPSRLDDLARWNHRAAHQTPFSMLPDRFLALLEPDTTTPPSAQPTSSLGSTPETTVEQPERQHRLADAEGHR